MKNIFAELKRVSYEASPHQKKNRHTDGYACFSIRMNALCCAARYFTLIHNAFRIKGSGAEDVVFPGVIDDYPYSGNSGLAFKLFNHIYEV